MKHLIVNLEATLMSFGREMVDQRHETHWFPTQSMLTGLMGNALGWTRADADQLQELQRRLVYAARIDREPPNQTLLTDYQTARLGADDEGWTTRGYPEGRTGDGRTYQSSHIMLKQYLEDARISVAVRLHDPEQDPTIEDLAVALNEPERPIYIGRKPCVPTARLFAGFVEAESTIDALMRWPPQEDHHADSYRAMWPVEEYDARLQPSRTVDTGDLRNWATRLHGGRRQVHEGRIPHDAIAA